MVRRHAASRLLGTALLVAGCGSDASHPLSPPSASGPIPSVSAPAAPALAAKPVFESPGGMWMPEQLAEKASELKSLGLELDPASLADPMSPTLSAIVSLGGCSASFVSPDGLLITNHHCALGALQQNSSPAQHLLKDGYLARTRAEEKWNGPTARVYVTKSFKDVTGEVRAGFESEANDLMRHRRMEARTKELVGACEKGRPSVRCSVASYFGGGMFVLVEQLELRDVRLVHAPPEGTGNFGGEIDNWRWPRHAGDYSFMRAYVAPDGSPADHGEQNVPYKPPHWLTLATKPLAEGELVFVAGYPGRTNRLRTAAEAEEAVGWYYPRMIAMSEQYLALYERLAKGSKDLEIKANNSIRGLGNRLTKMRGIMDGLVKGGLAAKKKAEEQRLVAWIDADPARKTELGDAVSKIAAVQATHAARRVHDAALGEVQQVVKLLDAATTIVRMAEERPKPDAERDPDFQERNWKRLEERLTSVQKQYDRVLDRGAFVLALQRALRLPEADRPETVRLLLGKGASAGDAGEAAIEKAVAALYAGTGLEDEKTRVELLRRATTAELAKRADPMLKLARELRPAQKEMDDRDDAWVGGMSMQRPRYIGALRRFRPGPLASDANGTLRVTYGTVRGYRPTTDAPVYRPFTTLAEMVAKATLTSPFDAPKAALEAAAAHRYGPYLDARLGDVPVDFLADLDITGGNSGSATLNARGELVGLAFDGNYESMASDWIFLPEVTRSIQVDVRYVLWNLDVVAHANELHAELSARPSIK